MPTTTHKDEWIPLFRKLVDAGVDVHLTVRDGLTAFHDSLDRIHCPLAFHQYAEAWLLLLRSCGVNTGRYMEEEINIMRKTAPDRVTPGAVVSVHDDWRDVIVVTKFETILGLQVPAWERTMDRLSVAYDVCQEFKDFNPSPFCFSPTIGIDDCEDHSYWKKTGRRYPHWNADWPFVWSPLCVDPAGLAWSGDRWILKRKQKAMEESLVRCQYYMNSRFERRQKKRLGLKLRDDMPGAWPRQL